MTNLEIVERALKTIADPDWEFHECVALYIASQLAQPQSSNNLDKMDQENNSITFYTQDGIEAMKIDANGDFFVNGNKVANDKEVYDGFKEWLMKAAREMHALEEK